MKIDRRDFLRITSAATLSTALPAVAAEAENSTPNAASTGKAVAIFTTAENTGHRIAQTGTVDFKDFGQPLETQICVFVDPTKTFQTHLGIGGALTDAAAETLAKRSSATTTIRSKASATRSAARTSIAATSRAPATPT